MRRHLALPVLTAVFLAAGMPSAAPAQGSAQPLAQSDWRSLRSEIERRYNLGLSASQDPATINADNTRYLWALEAKVQCGIAIGYLKSGNRDPISITKCQSASDRLQLAAAPVAPPEAPATQTCPDGSVILATSTCPAAAAPPPPPPPPVERGGGERGGGGALSGRLADTMEMIAAAGLARPSVRADAHGKSPLPVPTADGNRRSTNS